MALNLPSRGTGEDRTPIVKYDARAGRLFRVDRQQSDGSWESNTVEITPVFQAVMDLENIELGWLYFPTNGAPEIDVAPYGKPMPNKPSDKHRPGFRVHMKLGKQAGGDIREMAANAQVSIAGMDDLHDAYLKDAKAHPGELPVVRLEKTMPIVTTGKGQDGKPVSSQNYQPVWSIVGWAPRPPELVPPGTKVPPADAGHAAQAEAAATQKPVEVASIADDF
jgi:hypothetical protein